MIDEIDARILQLMQENARISNAEIARQVDMAPSAVLERIRKLEERGIILGYEARLNPRALGQGLLAYVFVQTSDRVGEAKAGQRLAAIPEVQEVHHVAGEDCFLVKVRAPDTEGLARILRERFGKIPSLRSTRTTIVLNTVKESGTLPVPPRQD